MSLFDTETYQGMQNEIIYRICEVRSRDERIRQQDDELKRKDKEIRDLKNQLEAHKHNAGDGTSDQKQIKMTG